MKKTCSKCGQEKELEEFSLHKYGRFGRNPACKRCKNEQAKEHYKANRESVLGRQRLRQHAGYNRSADLKRKFGITVEDYDKMLLDQGGTCKICKRAETARRLAVDHDHNTGEVRGLLCSTCNQGLGMFRDSVELLNSAVDYLEGTPDKRAGLAC